MSGDPLVALVGIAAPLLRPNINTDIIAPPARAGLPDRFGAPDDGRRRVFGPWRYDSEGTEDPNFILNRPPFDSARFLIAGPNFACGSSRETAAQWTRAFGIRCVIAPTFGGIFFNNCFRNGVLPLALEFDKVTELAALAEAKTVFSLDMPDGILSAGIRLPIELPAFRRKLLMFGGDELALTLAQGWAIETYQRRLRHSRPWVWPPGHF